MKNIFCSILLVVCTTTLVAQEKDKTVITTNVELFNKAIVNRDEKMLEKLTADQLSFGHSSGKVENKKEFVEGVLKGAVRFVTIELSAQTIDIAGKTAIVRHMLTGKIMNNDLPADLKLGILMIWERKKSNWKLLARQAVKL